MVTPETNPVDMKLCMRTHFCPCCGKIALYAGHGVRGAIGNDECPPNFAVRCPDCTHVNRRPAKEDEFVLVGDLPGFAEYDGPTFKYQGKTIVWEIM
jgi:hypothetical protein